MEEETGGVGNDSNCIYYRRAGSRTAVTVSRQCLMSFSDTYVGCKVKRSEGNKAKRCKVDYFRHAEERIWPVSLFWQNVDIFIERWSPIKVDNF
jgi:hypothetical protein